jgi:antitoxin (DNA-binding transcriptional repressor) of toxin-antitoxin stability system
VEQVRIEELKNGYAQLTERAHYGERILIVKGLQRRPWAILGPVESKGVSMADMIDNAERLKDELMNKHSGDLDAVMRELTQLLQAASTATALVEQERQKRMQGDHK